MMRLIVCVALIGYINGASVKLPEGVKACQIEATDRDECIRANFERALPELSKGIPELNLPSLDPLTRDSTLFEYTRGPLHVRVHANKMTIVGVSKLQVKAVRTKITDDGMSAEIDSFFPSMEVTGDYQSDNNYEGLQFKSSGKFNISLTDLSTTEKMSGRFVDRDGEKFYELEHFDLDVAMEDFKFFADGIFPDPELTRMVMTFINTYWKSLYQTVLPQTKPVWEPILVQESNKVLAKLPIESVLVHGEQKN